MTLPDSAHTWKVTVGGTDRTSLVRPGSLSWTTREGPEVSSARFILDDRAAALGDLADWQAVTITADPTLPAETLVFSGWAVKARPSPDETGQWLSWEMDCDGPESLLDRAPKISATYVGQTPKAILGALFTAAGLSGTFNTTTHVETGTALAVFSVDDEALSAAVDDLAVMAGMRWYIDPSLNVWMAVEASATLAAAFDVIVPATLADYGASLYDVRALTRVKDTSELVNRLEIVGGRTLGALVTDTFAGVDKTSTSIGYAFNLTYQNIRTAIDVTLEGVSQVAGTAWVDYFGKTLDNGSVVTVLVSRLNGVVYFPLTTVFADDDVIIAKYRVETLATLTLDASNSASSAASLALYGRYFDGRLEGVPISDAGEMLAFGEGYLEEMAFAVESGTFEVLRLGLKAGQYLGITSTRDYLSGDYPMRQVENAVLESGFVLSTVKWGGRRASLTAAMNRWRSSTGPAPVQGDMSVVNLSGVLTVLQPGTTFTAV